MNIWNLMLYLYTHKFVQTFVIEEEILEKYIFSRQMIRRALMYFSIRKKKSKSNLKRALTYPIEKFYAYINKPLAENGSGIRSQQCAFFTRSSFGG